MTSRLLLILMTILVLTWLPLGDLSSFDPTLLLVAGVWYVAYLNRYRAWRTER